mgnify:FL=1|tara:strand:- start:43 stop:879 length:837 start_codon:yes stop_codon:yes gene_type:complete
MITTLLAISWAIMAGLQTEGTPQISIAELKTEIHKAMAGRGFTDTQKKNIVASLVPSILHENNYNKFGHVSFGRRQAVQAGETLRDYLSDTGALKGKAYGLLQFDGGKKNNYLKYLNITGKKDSSQSQLNFFFDDLQGKLPDSIGIDNRDMGFGNARDLMNAFNVADADPKVLISDLNQYYFKAGTPHLEARYSQIGKVDLELPPQQQNLRTDPIQDLTSPNPMQQVQQDVQQKFGFKLTKFGTVTMAPMPQNTFEEQKQDEQVGPISKPEVPQGVTQ